MSSTVVLVPCGKRKAAVPCAARDLYTSPRFDAMRQYAEARGDAWYILSAEHGLVAPDDVLAPYDLDLRKVRKPDRIAWAERVQARLLDVLPAEAEVVILAGMAYREHLVPFLRARGFSVAVPLEGLKSGQGYQRVKQMLASIHAR